MAMDRGFRNDAMNHPAFPVEYPTVDLSAARSTVVGPPRWFRLAILGTATLILCSCTTGAPTSNLAISQQAHPQTLPMSPQQTLPESSQAFPPGDINQVVGSRWSQTPPDIPSATGVVVAACNCPMGHDGQQASNNSPPLTLLNPPCGCSLPLNAYAPAVGPGDEYLCDGGDDGLPVGVRQDWTVEGLEQEDTIAHYDTVDGRTVVTPSSRVCIYAPRFGAVRRVTDLQLYAHYDRADGFEQELSPTKIEDKQKATPALALLEPSIHRDRQPSSLLRERQQTGQFERRRRVAEFDGLLAPYANLQVMRTGTISNDEKALVARSSLAAVSWAGDQGPQVVLDSKQAHATVSEKQVGVIYRLNEPNKPRLRLLKMASSSSAKLGEVVEFTLRFDNIGNREIGNVTIVDNLTTRLEYVPESSKSSLPADFSTEPNDHGSVVLRWEIRDPLAAGKGGILQFKCKVR
jgi:uncharacterized repeat protein (TIGR01451 family)